MRINGTSAWIVSTLLFGAVSLGGCATKQYVNEQVAGVDGHVRTVEGRVTDHDARLAAHDARLAGLDKSTREALERADAAGKLAEGKFVYALVLSDDTTRFQPNKWELSTDAQAKLTDFAGKLKTDNKNVYVEIQGHTDATGSAELNYRLGAERAEAVRRYLNMQGVALNRMATISYGKDDPVAPNKSKAGRSQNRRVVLIVLA